MTAPNQWSLTYKSDYSRENWLKIWNDKKEREEAKNFSKKCRSQAFFGEGSGNSKRDSKKSGSLDDNIELQKFKDNCKIVFLFPDLDSKKLSPGRGSRKVVKLDTKHTNTSNIEFLSDKKTVPNSTDI
eukprot:TRINITY_DN34007_c0_g1_i1.p1 TRINITY_DN34007_c0_g1~~TRINITY_DN34007_c0_g1_i1.p1  ORF type:complete len:128 (-),score=25.52 TRINITY_DN34007_c0_g1_i1:38-421(-)